MRVGVEGLQADPFESVRWKTIYNQMMTELQELYSKGP